MAYASAGRAGHILAGSLGRQAASFNDIRKLLQATPSGPERVTDGAGWATGVDERHAAGPLKNSGECEYG
jgi:hypothetical protein